VEAILVRAGVAGMGYEWILHFSSEAAEIGSVFIQIEERRISAQKGSAMPESETFLFHIVKVRLGEPEFDVIGMGRILTEMNV
jgi:hypothetical protein